MTTERKKIIDIFRTIEGSTDWSICADRFIRLCLKGKLPKSLKNLESFAEDYDPTKSLWENGIDFFGYSENYEEFAGDWIDEDEKEIYIREEA